MATSLIIPQVVDAQASIFLDGNPAGAAATTVADAISAIPTVNVQAPAPLDSLTENDPFLLQAAGAVTISGEVFTFISDSLDPSSLVLVALTVVAPTLAGGGDPSVLPTALPTEDAQPSPSPTGISPPDFFNSTTSEEPTLSGSSLPSSIMPTATEEPTSSGSGLTPSIIPTATEEPTSSRSDLPSSIIPTATEEPTSTVDTSPMVSSSSTVLYRTSGPIISPIAPTTPPPHPPFTTIYTTEYITVCPTTKPCQGGIKTQTYTITDTCSNEQGYTRPPVPPHFTTSVTVCNHCPGKPTYTVTCPIDTHPTVTPPTGAHKPPTGSGSGKAIVAPGNPGTHVNNNLPQSGNSGAHVNNNNNLPPTKPNTPVTINTVVPVHPDDVDYLEASNANKVLFRVGETVMFTLIVGVVGVFIWAL